MARRTRQNEMSGFWDLFKRKKTPEQKALFDVFAKPPSQLPALPSRPGEIVPAPKKPSLIDVFRPKTQLPAKPAPAKKEISLPEVLAPKLPARPRPPEKAVEWTALIPRETPEEAKPLSEVARTAFKPRDLPPPKYVFIQPSAPPEVEAKRAYELVVAPQTRAEWKLPTREELADHFRKTNDLEAMWNFIRDVRSNPAFKKDQVVASWRGDPMLVPLDPVVYKEKFTDFANFYGIPWGVMQMYLSVPPEQADVAEEALWTDVLSPLNAMVPEAFELLKPQDIPGFFNVSFMEPSGQYYLFYVEPLIGIGGQGAA